MDFYEAVWIGYVVSQEKKWDLKKKKKKKKEKRNETLNPWGYLGRASQHLSVWEEEVPGAAASVGIEQISGDMPWALSDPPWKELGVSIHN